MITVVGAAEEPDLPPVEIALNVVRRAAYRALEVGASRHQVDAAVAEAKRILDRQGGPRP